MKKCGNVGRSANKDNQDDKRIRKLSYEEGLKRCQMTTLGKRRSRGDLIESFNIFFIGEGKPFASKAFKNTKSASTRERDCKVI